MSNAGDANQWRFALARMGVNLRDLPMFPGQSPEMAEQIRRKVADMLQRYKHTSAPEPKA
jgi:hypothetical protein